MKATPFRDARRDPLLVALLAALLFLPGLGAHDLWNPDEPRYVEVAREMLLTGDFFVPQLNGEVYTQKPPLFFWTICAASVFTGGPGEMAARLPSALAAIGAVVVTFLLGRLLFDRRAAWLAALAYATCTKVLWQGHVGQIDMFLGFWVVLAVYCWARGWVEQRPALYPLFFLFTGVATLAKGPAGFLPPLLAVLVFLAWQQDRRALRELRLGRGLLIYLAVVLAWLVPAIVIGGQEYFEQIVWKQNVTRFANSWHHHRPFYYYLKVIPLDFFPWSFFLPAALWAGWRRLRDEGRQRFFFALVWVVVTVVFFSIPSGKRTVYILSAYPGLALLIGAGLAALWTPAREAAAHLPRLGTDGTHRRCIHRRWLTWPAGFLAVLFAAAVAAVPKVAAGKPEAEPLGEAFPVLVAAVLAVLAAAFAGAWWAALRGRIDRFAAAVTGGMAVMSVVGFVSLVPKFDVVKSARPLSERLLALSRPDEPYAIYPLLDPPFVFYTRRFAVTVAGEEELRELVARPGPLWLLIERAELAQLDPPLPLVEVARDRDVKGGYILLTRPDLAAERAGVVR